MGRRHLTMLLVLGAIWGPAFMLIEIALRDLAPGTLIAGRLTTAALALALVAASRREVGATAAALRPLLWPFALAGLFNVTVPFFLIAWGQQFIDSGIAAILNASAPLFTVLLAVAVLRSERVRGLRLLGFVVGFAGVVVLVGGQPRGDAEAILGSLAVVAAAACYAFGALYAARRLVEVPALTTSLGILVSASIFALPLGVAGVRDSRVGWESLAAVLVLGVAATALAFQLYFALIAGAGASRAILVTYVVPSTALLYGVLLLDEPLTAAAVLGLVLVLVGVTVGTGAIDARRRAAIAGAAPRGR